MFADKSDLLEQINSVIKKNTLKEEPSAGDYSNEERSADDLKKHNLKSYYPFIKNSELIRKLEQRIEALEEQNDHLLYFIHFLFHNFTGLVVNIISSENITASEPALKEEKKCCEENKKDKPCLTKREIDVFNLLVKGLCAKEIARMLYISETTVITHKRNLKEKFNAKNTVELISKANAFLNLKD